MSVERTKSLDGNEMYRTYLLELVFQLSSFCLKVCSDKLRKVVTELNEPKFIYFEGIIHMRAKYG